MPNTIPNQIIPIAISTGTAGDRTFWPTGWNRARLLNLRADLELAAGHHALAEALARQVAAMREAAQ